ncbi:hypothetical protein AAC387_Pa07g1162 [Persea americana]
MGDQYPPPVINHSSHDHRLVLLNCPTTHSTSSCAGCEQHLYGLIYTCDHASTPSISHALRPLGASDTPQTPTTRCGSYNTQPILKATSTVMRAGAKAEASPIIALPAVSTCTSSAPSWPAPSTPTPTITLSSSSSGLLPPYTIATFAEA